MGVCCTKETTIRAPDQEATEEPRHVAEVPREADLRSGEVKVNLLSVFIYYLNRIRTAEEVQHKKADQREHSPKTVANLPSSPGRKSPTPDNSSLTPLETIVYVLDNSKKARYHCNEGCSVGKKLEKDKKLKIHIKLSLGEAIQKGHPPCKKCAKDIRN
jgi:hypothetical protein